MFWILLLGAGALAAGGSLGLRFWLLKINQVHYFRCSRCGLKLRYRACQAGKAVMCPSCKQRATLPETPEAAPAVPGGNAGYRVRRRTVDGKATRV
jgi:hypothetical protein